MKKNELEERLQKWFYHHNYCINSEKGTNEQIACWKYGREMLEIIMKMVKNLEVENEETKN